MTEMMKEKKFGGIVNDLMISINSFYPYNRHNVSQKEMTDTINQIQATLRDFEKDENRLFLSAEELCPTDKVQLCTGLAESYVHYKSDKLIADNHFTFSIGDAILTSPIEGIYRCERIGYLPEKGFYIATRNSYYMSECLTVNEDIRQRRKRIYKYCSPSSSCWLDYRRCTELLWN